MEKDLVANPFGRSSTLDQPSKRGSEVPRACYWSTIDMNVVLVELLLRSRTNNSPHQRRQARFPRLPAVRPLETGVTRIDHLRGALLAGLTEGGEENKRLALGVLTAFWISDLRRLGVAFKFSIRFKSEREELEEL